MKKINYFSFFTIYGIVFILILSKTILVPITHDEMATPTSYINYSVWQIMMYHIANTNNHILNTLIVRLFVYLFGISQVVVRLPNLLSFIVYAVAVFRINRTALKEYSIWFIPASLLFIAWPYFLDFFGLCRGYGMSCALAALSLSYMLSGFLFSRNRDIWVSFILSILASYANFTLLIFCLANIILTWFYFYSVSAGQLKRIINPSIIIVVVSLLYSALIATPIYKITSTGQLDYFASSGIFSGTIISYIILCAIAGFFIYVFSRPGKDKNRLISLKNHVFVSFSALMLTVFITIMQCIIMKTPGPRGRTALFFFPLTVACFVCLAGLIPSDKRIMIQYISAFLISISCVFNVAYTYNLKYAIQWKFDESTFDILEYLEDEKQPGSTVVLKTDWHFFPSFYFYSYAGKTPWLDLKGYDKNIDTGTDAEYYYIFSASYSMLETEFEPVYKVTEDRWLLRRTKEEK